MDRRQLLGGPDLFQRLKRRVQPEESIKVDHRTTLAWRWNRQLTAIAVILAIATRHDAVQAWHEAGAARAALRETLRAFPDLERLAARLACGKSSPRDLGAIRDALARLPEIARAADTIGDPGALERREALAGAPALLERLRQALTDDPPPASREGGVIRPGFDAERDALDDLAHSGKKWIAELEATERARTGIGSLKVGFNRVFGYYLEVTHAHKDRVPADWERRQTLTTAENLLRELDQVARRGLAVEEDEREVGVYSLAAPVRDHTGAVVAALAMTAPRYRAASNGASGHAELLLAAASELSRRIGGSVDPAGTARDDFDNRSPPRSRTEEAPTSGIPRKE